jgi:hypothetical protein
MRRQQMKKLIYSCIALVFVLTLANIDAIAQKETDTGVQIERDLELLRKDLRTEKKKIIAMNVPFTADEATRFWPLYDQYTEAMRKHNDTFYGIIKDYAANQKTLTDAQAMDILKRWSAVQVDIAQTRQKYVPMFEKVIPGRKAAHFLQIDRRLYELMDLQVASEVPLVLQ